MKNLFLFFFFVILSAASIANPGYAEKPIPPNTILLSVDSYTDTTVSLSWTYAITTITVDGFDIDMNQTHLTSLTGSSNTSYIVTGLSPGTTYTFSVSAYEASTDQSSPESNEVTVTTSGTSSGGGGTNDDYVSIILSDENYIYTRTYLNPVSLPGDIQYEEDVLENVTYFDGLGRDMQHISIKSAPDKTDVITHFDYDENGRPIKDWLPYQEDNGNVASYRGDVASATKTYYQINYGNDFTGVAQQDINPYSKKTLDNSPLNRIMSQAAPGFDWRAGGGHEIEFIYDTNGLNEVLMYDVDFAGGDTKNPNLIGGGNYYPPNELHKKITTDENGHKTEEFTEKNGNFILKRAYNGLEILDTYYVYDYYGNLTYVLPPKVVHDSSISSTEKSELCYQYKYDERNRLIEKKIPGKDWEFIVYNDLNQPVLTQDRHLRDQDKWLYTKYDAFGRVVSSGLFSNGTATQGGMQTLLNNYYDNNTTKKAWETKTTSSTNHYYTNDSFPISNLEVLTLNYYDNYTFDTTSQGIQLSSSASVFDKPVDYNVKGLATGTKVKVLGQSTTKWITTVLHYDDKGMEIYSGSYDEFLLSKTTIKKDLDFTGNVEKIETYHKKGSGPAITMVDEFTYDHSKRLTKHTQSINGSAKEVIAENTYDDLGQLVTKGVGNGDTSSSRLQDIDYTYNVRGWLKTINDIGNTNKLFNFKISYNDPSSGTALYNGNISRVDWRTDNTDNNLKNYRYYYDDLNRITSATGHSSTYNLSNVTYDKNGNIKTLKRGNSGSMDNLSYGYKNSGISNRLAYASDASDNASGFKDIAGSNDYTYDTNGNLTSDANKGITSITYNHLNLPVEVEFNNSISQTIHYTYDATGVKLKKEIPGKTTDYAGNYIYENGNLRQFSHSEGYVEPDGNGGYDYVYSYLDHLGNTRLNYSDLNGNGTIEASSEILDERNYYPFGLEHQGYNTTIVSENNYKTYQGKENQKELGLNWHDFGARQYDAALGRWFSPDPLSEEFSSWSPYNAMSDNPINFIDPTGMAAEWIPKINADGSASYIAEDGDSAATLSSQYGISQNDAEAITGSSGDTEIKEGTEISGETVNNVTGSEVMKLDLNSKEGRSSQRRFDQFLFARDHSSSKGAWAFLSTDYYSNTKFKSMMSGNAVMNIDGSQINLHYNIPLYRPGTYDNSNTATALSNAPLFSKQTSGQRFSGNQENIYLPLYHPNGNNAGQNYIINLHTRNSNKVYSRLGKDFPQYNYIRIPRSNGN